MCPIKETLEFNYWEFGRATKEYPEIFNSRSAWKPEISWLDLSRQQQSCLYSIRGRLAGFEILSFSIFQIHLSNQEWKMLGKETNWISIKLNDLKIAQFKNPDIGNQHIGNNFMSFSIFSLEKCCSNKFQMGRLRKYEWIVQYSTLYWQGWDLYLSLLHLWQDYFVSDPST